MISGLGFDAHTSTHPVVGNYTGFFIMITQMTPPDLDQVNTLADYIYPNLWEPNEAFSVKLNLFPQGCFVAKNDDKIVGYIFSHPWISTEIVSLGQIICLPNNPDCYYLHDCAVDPNHRNKGIGKQLVDKTLEIAKGYGNVKLVSVLNSEEFWKKYGFIGVKEVQYTESVKGLVMEKNYT